MTDEYRKLSREELRDGVWTVSAGNAALGVAYAAQQCSELLIAGAPGIHFYALNRAPATRAVLGALRAARPWERRRDDSDDLAKSL